MSAAVWDSSLTDLNTHKNEIIQLFNEKYMFRMINRETLEQWQIRLQTILDIEGPKADRALRLYRLNAAEMEKVMETQKTTYNNLTDAMSGTDTSRGSVADTPDAILNEGDQYADSVARNQTTYGRKNTRTGEVETVKEPQGGIVEAINDSIDGYRNLIDDFVSRFNKLFMSVYWY